MEIIPYSPDLAPTWDSAVAAARNATFQHFRGYMDYHADRFADCSVLAADAKGRIIAVLPAHSQGDTVCSHRGLSFGGWLMSPKADMPAMMEVWADATTFFRNRGFSQLYYRPAPHIFHRYPAEEDLYALFRAGAVLDASLVSATVDLAAPLPFDSNARRAVRKAQIAGITVAQSDDFAAYWAILTACLTERHNVRPVHTIDEILLLHSRFPDNIVLHMACDSSGNPVAGVLMYLSPGVAHCQYIASTPQGRDTGALPLLFDYLQNFYAAKGFRWFDYGTSCEDAGHYLNPGLIRQKCGFGARAIVYNAFSLKL